MSEIDPSTIDVAAYAAGGGMYALPDGTRKRGAKAARRHMADLMAAGWTPETPSAETPSEGSGADPVSEAVGSAQAPQAAPQAAQPSFIGTLPEPRVRAEPERAPVAYPEHDAGYIGQLPRRRGAE